MSAPFRYARILNGLSSLISSRSAISRSTRAMPALSMRVPLDAEAFALDGVVEQPRTAVGQRARNRGARVRRSIAEQTPSAAGTADFGRRRARLSRPRDQAVDRRRRDARRQTLAVLPLGRDVPSYFVPVPALEGAPHRHRRVANALE